MKKKLIEEIIFTKNYNGDHAVVRISDIPPDVLPTDIIHIERDNGFYSENNSWDPFTELVIIREREETDAEFEERKKENEEYKKELKKRRYESYLSLKKEFENGEL
jgi:hypothetical protein